MGQEKAQCIRHFWGQYKYYFSAENTMCRWYITEKFWKGFLNGLVPIALGATKEDYAAVSPKGSYIHVEDFESPQKLAEYLLELEKTPSALRKFHLWRDEARVVKYVAPDWCSLCEALHNAGDKPPGQNRELMDYWFKDAENEGKDACRKKRW